MSNRNYIACRYPVSAEHPIPPSSFLDQLIDAINPLPDSIFARNDRHDIYSVMLGALGPYTDLLHRKAVMCEVLRVTAAFESDWNWNAAVDINNPNSVLHKEGEETGAFQVSWDSTRFDQSLLDCLDRLAGGHDVDTFIASMKSNHALAVEYCARLLRFNTTWCGTINTASMVIAHVRRDAVQEFKGFLTLNQQNIAASVAMATNQNAQGDAASIPALISLAANEEKLDNVQTRAAAKLLQFDGEIYPSDGCAITLSLLLQDSGIDVPDIYQALDLTKELRDNHHWEVIELGNQQAGDIGTTCGDIPHHGLDHIYLVLKKINDDEMLIADNQASAPHFRWASGQGGKTPTKFFLRAV